MDNYYNKKNNALKFTKYGPRKGIINTENSSSVLPTISISQSSHCVTENNNSSLNSLISPRIKGIIDFKRNVGRNFDDNYKIIKTPSSFDYRPNFGNMNKYANKDDEYKRKKFKLLKMMKNYECRPEYQIVDI